MPAMQELATFEPIDEVRYKLGINKEDIGVPTAYLGKGIRNYPDLLEIVDQYMKYVARFPNFRDFIAKADFEPVVEQDPVDLMLQQEEEKINKQYQEAERAKGELAQQS